MCSAEYSNIKSFSKLVTQKKKKKALQINIYPANVIKQMYSKLMNL